MDSKHHDGEVAETSLPSKPTEVAETLTHDSMVTVRLSEPPASAPALAPPTLTVDTSILPNNADVEILSALSNEDTEIEHTTSVQTPDIALDDVHEVSPQDEDESPRITMMDPNGNELVSPMTPGLPDSSVPQDADSRRGSESSEASGSEEVNWEELEKTEEQEPRDESSDDVSCTQLRNVNPNANSNSRLPYCWPDWSRKITCWPRTRNLELRKCKWSKHNETEANRGRHLYNTSRDWSMAPRRLRCGTP